MRLIKLDDGDKLVAMAQIDAEPDKPAGDGAAPAATAGDLPPSAVGDDAESPTDPEGSADDNDDGADGNGPGDESGRGVE